jgi:DNA-binding beta-propeller fold protein YncE
MNRLIALLTFAVVCGLQTAVAATPAAPSASAKGLLYVGAWPHTVIVIDEATETVLDRIDLKTDVPESLTLSRDRKTLVVTTVKHSGIQVIDVATRKVTNAFELDNANTQTRLGAVALDPDCKYLYSIVAPATKEIDRFSIEDPKFVVVDLAQKKIIRSAEFPKDLDHFGVAGMAAGYMGGLRISPDGKFLYLFRQSILVFDTKEFKLVEKIDLEKPLYAGMQTLAIDPTDDPYAPPGVITSLFRTTDPFVHVPVFGIAHFDLTTREVDFTPVGPAANRMLELHVTPDRKKGYTVAFSGVPPNRRTEFWEFDMDSKKLVKKVEFDGRRRFDMAMSSDGKSLYIYIAGFDVEIYDAGTLKLRKTIDLNADVTTNMVVIPGA